MEQTTQNTPAEVVYQPEAELPPITSLDDLSHIRAIDKQGRSVTMTPAQIRELTGLDYSKLEEQIVPGEHWPDPATGELRQVYIRTFIGITPMVNNATFGIGLDIMTLLDNAKAARYICGDIGDNYPYTFADSGGVKFNNNIYWSYDCGVGLRIIGSAAPINNIGGKAYNSLGDRAYKLTFKYIR